MTPAEGPARGGPRERLRALIAARSLRQGRFTLSSGADSAFYFNMKETIFDPEGSLLVADLFLAELEARPVDYVGGLELGAVPLAACLGLRSAQVGRPVRAFYVRKVAKSHGLETRIDVALTPGARAAILEDVTTTGASVLRAVDAVRAAGCLVEAALTIVDREAGAADLLRAAGVELTSLFMASDFELSDVGNEAGASYPPGPGQFDLSSGIQ